MKKHFIILAAAALTLASCGGNTNQNAQPTGSPAATSNVSEAKPAVTPEFINQKVKELIRYIPDHKLMAGSEKYITPEYYSLLKKAFELPPQETDGIDEASEFLYYFIEGNGDCTASMADGVYDVENDKFDADKFFANHQFANFKTTIDGDKAVAEFDYIHGNPDETDHHKITLKKVGENWLIDDWNDNKKDVKNYIDNYGK